KYGSLFCLAVMISMAFGFFVGGFFSAVILWAVILAAGFFILR
ncbi:aa3-type cytochrome c oxidase subunit IV, partial [Mesorhizobium sp. M2D.F.Ca.ET.178.01.1.1]